MKKSSLFLFTSLLFISSFAQNQDGRIIERIDPPNWYSGMENPAVELLFYVNTNENLQFNLTKESKSFACINSVEKSKLNNYYFVELIIKKQPKNNKISLLVNGVNSNATELIQYTVTPKSYSPLGLNQSDAIYLIFPDRFSNGDPNNESFSSYFQKTERNELKGRRGGDLKGIINHLTYIENLGFNALWLNPIVENNEKVDSYHGYATTDSYFIDPRIGSRSDLDHLTNLMSQKKMKHVWDVVYNHWGDQHKLFLEMPDSAWFHWYPNFTKTNYRAETMMDPHASEFDKSTMANGWFDHHMPDLNQQNPHLAKYLIQNSIWWVETAHIDAFRIDTYSYPDQAFMAKLNASLKTEYPNLFNFGETWVQGTPIQAWFTEGNRLNTHFNSQLNGVTDFQLFYALTKGLTENFGWEEGLRRIELTLAHDYQYEHPENLVTFLDNHDLPRIYSVFNQDLMKWKMAHAMLYTLRGIPCTYYGTEILMTGFCNPDAHVREEFPGGWDDHKTNLFKEEERTALQNEAFQFIKKLVNYRKMNTWMTTGKLIQFVPNDNTYVYAKKGDSKTLICLYNLNQEVKQIHTAQISEVLNGQTTGRNILSHENITWNSNIEIPGNQFLLIEVSH
ncbi:MAG: alpha-amylase [Bacteroidetes bacterium]|nr:alpha-amylase [Bacteroidota bacterium]